jgi:PAS domain S-box-containing protein
MMDLIRNFFSSEAFIPHGHCYLWKPELVWLNVLSDSLIALAYYSIPLTLFHFVRKRQDLPFNWIFLLFATFITACGTTHILEVWTLWHPTYWLSGTVKGGTAIVSVYTAMMMVPLVPKALAFPSPTQIETANRELQREIAERQQTEALLRQSEAALQRSKARYRAIVEDQTELICRFSPDGTLTFVNNAYCCYFERTQAEVIQHSYLPVVLEEDLAKAEGQLNRLSQENSVTTITSQVIRPDGIRTQHWIAQAIFDLQGELVEFQAVGRDITDQKQAEERLRQSEERLNAIVTHISDGILVLNRDGLVQFANPAATQIFGQELPNQLLEVPVDELSEIEIPSFEGTRKFVELKLSTAEWIGEPEYIVVLRDVTDRKRAETALRESDERFRMLFQNLSVGVLLQGANAEILSSNPKALELLRLTDDQLLGKTSFDPDWQVIHEDGSPFPGVDHPVPQAIATRQPVRNVMMGVCHSCSEEFGSGDNAIWLLVSAEPQLTPDGAIQNVICTLIDISDRKRAETALRESEQRFQAFMNHNPTAAWITDGNGKLLYVSPTYHRLFKLPADYVSGERDLTIHPPEFAQQYLQNIQRVVTTQQVVEEIEPALRPDGTVGEFLVYKFPISGTEEHCLVGGIAVDITDRKRMERDLQESEERLQLALEASGDGLWDWNIVTGELYCSPRYWEMVGYGANELQQDLSAWEQLVHPDDIGQVQNILTAHLRDSSVPYKVDYRLRTRSGEWKWINAYGKVVMRDQQGNPLRMLGTVRDISDRKQVEQILQRYERIVSATTDGISLVDRNYVYQVVNQAYLSWNYTQYDEVVGHSVSHVIGQEAFETIVKARLDQCLAGETVQYETWFDHFPTSPRFLSVTYAPYVDVDQTISGVVVSLRDLTRLKQAEKQLELQSIIVRNIAEGVCLTRATDGVIVYTNPKFDRMFGYEPEELTGEHVASLNYEDVQTNTNQIADQIMGEIIQCDEFTYDVHNVKKDGTPFWCKAVASMFEHPEHGSVIVAVQQDITEQRQAQAQIETSLKEKEILLKEIHHRVKNNLQIIYSILRLQRRSLQDPRASASLLDSQNRIESIALIHEKLYQTGNLAQVNFAEYIPGIVSNLVSSYDTSSQAIDLETEVEPIFLDIDRAIPCGLLINELVSNSLKYAFPNQEAGQIKVSLRADENFYMTLIVKDDGVGLPKNFDITQAESLGLQLVQDFVDQLKGRMQIGCSTGTEFRITFPGGGLG